MKLLILTTSLFLTVVALEQQCVSESKPEAWTSSDAEFWKGIEGAEYITELDDNSHTAFTKDNSKAFVMYYATWCGYSQQARNGFAGAAKSLNGKVPFGAVDCDKARNACRVNPRITGYPTFYYYKDGAWNDEYRGQRTTQGFVNYLNRK